MGRSDFITTLVVIGLIAGAVWYVTRNRQTADASYYEARPDYFDTDPAQLPNDWTGWNARVDVFVHHRTNRQGCNAVESGWLTWQDRVPVVVVNTGTGKRVTLRTDRIRKAEDLNRFPLVELPFDRGVDIKVSTRLQRSQYLVNWTHKYGFRFVPNSPNAWRDYYQLLRQNPGETVIIPAVGHTMKDCRTTPEQIECEHGGNNKRCQDERYSDRTQFLYPDWAADFPRELAHKVATTSRPSLTKAKPLPELAPTPEDAEPLPWN